LYLVYTVLLFVFFFQAEDGIRDFHVTGVQTCALPIYAHSCQPAHAKYSGLETTNDNSGTPRAFGKSRLREYKCKTGSKQYPDIRSEERRVGKECRSRR